MNFEKTLAWATFFTQITIMTIKHNVLRFNVFGEIPTAFLNIPTIQTQQIDSTKLIRSCAVIFIKILLKPELLLYITQEISFMLGSSMPFEG